MGGKLNKAKVSKVLLILFLVNIFSNFTIFLPRIAKAETLPVTFSNRFTYNEIGKEYTSPDNNLTILINSIEKVDKTSYDEYKVTITQRNDTASPIEEGVIRMYFHNKDSEIPTAILKTLVPGEAVTKTYTFRSNKDDIPWMILYTGNHNPTNIETLLKWDITPDEHKGKSSNNNLKMVETNHGNNLTEISVPSTVTSININPIPEDSKSTVTGGGTYDLVVGDNIFNIVVTSEMGTTKEYSFKVKRLSGNANLASLRFSEGTLTPEFNKDVTEYTLKVSRNDFTLSIYPTAEDSKSKVSYKSSVYINGHDKLKEVITVTSQDGTTKNYTVNIVSPSKNPTLNNIILNNGDINFTFDPNANTQNIRVNADVDTLNVQAIPTSSTSTIESGNGDHKLKEGENEILIKVIAEDTGYTRYYTLKVYKTNNNTNLKGIYFGRYSENLIDGFDPSKTEYEMTVVKIAGYGDSYKLTASPENYKSKVEKSYGNTVDITLKLGINEFKFKCISEQGDFKEYTLKINYREESTDTKINKLVFNTGEMEPAFNPDIKSYTITVPRNTEYLDILELETADPNGWVSNVAGGSYTTRLRLQDLDNYFTFTVRAEAGNTEEYKFKVSKIRNSNSNLSALQISMGELTPKFDKNIKEYTATVRNSIDSVNLSYGLEDHTATVTGIGEHKLNLGLNKLNVTVTAEDGSTTTYTINVTRNNLPQLNVSDITFEYGDSIDLLKGATATDIEDGNITSKIVANAMQWPITSMGEYDICYRVTDSAGDTVEKYTKLRVVERQIKKTEIIGTDRYDTAVKLSKSKFSTSNIAVLVNGNALADGLAVTPLATFYKAPILLTGTSSMPKVTMDELKRLGVKKVIIAGGTGVVSNAVVNQLKTIGVSTVDRVAGIDRYETSLEIAKYIDKNCYDIENIVVCYGRGEADALSISAVAARDRMAIIMTDKNAISSTIESWLKSESINNAYIIGGTGVVSNNILNKINGLTKENIVNNRIGGIDRYHTNAIVIERFYGKIINKIYLANGISLVDALASGAIGGLEDAPVMLINRSMITNEQYDLLNKIQGNELVKVGGGITNTVVEVIGNHLKY